MLYSVSTLNMGSDPLKGLLEFPIYHLPQKVYHKLFTQNTGCLQSDARSVLLSSDHPQQWIIEIEIISAGEFLELSDLAMQTLYFAVSRHQFGRDGSHLFYLWHWCDQPQKNKQNP